MAVYAGRIALAELSWPGAALLWLRPLRSVEDLRLALLEWAGRCNHS